MKKFVDEKTFNKVKELLDKGLTGVEVCRTVNISQPTLYRIKKHDTFEEFHTVRKAVKAKKEKPLKVDMVRFYVELNNRLDRLEEMISELQQPKKSWFRKK